VVTLGGDNYGFADGHVQWIKRKKLPDGTSAKEPDADCVTREPEVGGANEVGEPEWMLPASTGLRREGGCSGCCHGSLRWPS
jgi:prepilin-type processing-associated H-X9-DG protein